MQKLAPSLEGTAYKRTHYNSATGPWRSSSGRASGSFGCSGGVESVTIRLICLRIPSGSSPSINNWGDIAFQANTGSLWMEGDLRAGMMAGTSPAIDDGKEIAFQANTGNLDVTGTGDEGSDFAMAPGTSPALGHESGYALGDPNLAYQGSDGDLNTLDGPTGKYMAAGTSPSVNDNGEIAFQGTNGSLYTWEPPAFVTNLHAGMAKGTSPSINNYGVIAFQANTGNLNVTGTGDIGLAMMAGTSPSIDAYGTVAFQGSNGDLWTWSEGYGGRDIGLGMMAGTSPSIQPGLAFDAPPPPTSVIRGGPDNDPLNGGSGHDLIRGGQGNDLIRGRRGKDRSYGGPGNDLIRGGRGDDFLYGGAGNDRIYGGPGKDKIVDHRGATTAFAGSGANLVDVDDGRGDDRVVCAPGTITDVFADRRDRIARSCNERVRQPRSVR